MKKRTKQILAVMLVSALAVSTGNVVRAEDAQEPEVQVQEIVEEVGASEEVKKNVGDISKSRITIADGSQMMSASVIKYTPDDVKGNGMCGFSQRFDAPGKGVLDFSIGEIYGPGIMKDGVDPGQLFYGVFADENMTRPVEYSSVPWADMEVNYGEGDYKGHYFNVPSAGTYYVGIYSDASSVAASQYQRVNVVAGLHFYNASDRAIHNGEKTAVGQKDDQTNYFEFKAEETGSLAVWRREKAHKCTVTLCDSAKKPLSGTIDLEKAPIYGVTKGKTYYIRIDAKKSSENPYYVFQADNRAVSEKSGSSKAKAATISDKSYKEGTIEAGSGQEDWYKFKLTKKKKVTIKMSSSSNDALKITVYRGNKKISSKIARDRHADTVISSSGKWAKGTYYIRMQRANKNSSGVYHLRVR